MGLMDVITGVMNGPRGQAGPQTAARGGMSPMTMAVLGVLAFKALKSSGILGGAQTPAAGGESPVPRGQPQHMASADIPGGGLADMLSGLFGGASAGSGSMSGPTSGALATLLGGASGGALLSGGLSTLINDLQSAGHGQAAQSWVGSGPNQPIAPNDLAAALGSDTIDSLAAQTGMSRENLLAGLSQHLPDVIDQLTPQARVPSESEAAQLLDTTSSEAAERRPH
jgi:uncharacterized protein YidB (DUF937 family)